MDHCVRHQGHCTISHAHRLTPLSRCVPRCTSPCILQFQISHPAFQPHTTTLSLLSKGLTLSLNRPHFKHPLKSLTQLYFLCPLQVHSLCPSKGQLLTKQIIVGLWTGMRSHIPSNSAAVTGDSLWLRSLLPGRIVLGLRNVCVSVVCIPLQSR